MKDPEARLNREMLEEEIEDLAGFPSERPSQVDFKISFASIHPPKSKKAAVFAIIVALGAIAELLHEIFK